MYDIVVERGWLEIHRRFDDFKHQASRNTQRGLGILDCRDIDPVDLSSTVSTPSCEDAGHILREPR